MKRTILTVIAAVLAIAFLAGVAAFALQGKQGDPPSIKEQIESKR